MPHIGIIGAGARSIVLIEYIKQNATCHLEGVCDIDSERLKVFKRLSQIQTLSFTNYQDLLRNHNIDTVIITTPDYSHTRIMLDSLQAGKHVLCEKPAATKLDDVNRILYMLNKYQDLVCSTYLVLRFHPLYQALIDAIPQIGNIKLIIAGDYVPGAGYFRRWHRWREKSGGLVLHEGIHLLDIIQLIVKRKVKYVSANGKLQVYLPNDKAGDVCSACALSGSCEEYFDKFADPLYELYNTPTQQEGYPRDLCVYNSGKDTPDAVAAHLEFTDGPLLAYTLCLFAPHRTREIKFIGDNGLLYCDEASKKLALYPRGKGKVIEQVVQVPGERYGGGDKSLFNAFMQNIEAKHSNQSDFRQALDSMITALALEKSLSVRSDTWISQAENNSYLFSQNETGS